MSCVRNNPTKTKGVVIESFLVSWLVAVSFLHHFAPLALKSPLMRTKTGFLAITPHMNYWKLSKKLSNLPCVWLGDLYNEVIWWIVFVEWLTDKIRLSVVSSWDHCQRFSSSQISDKLRLGLKSVQNLSLDFVGWSCAVVVTFFILDANFKNNASIQVIQCHHVERKNLDGQSKSNLKETNNVKKLPIVLILRNYEQQYC